MLQKPHVEEQSNKKQNDNSSVISYSYSLSFSLFAVLYERNSWLSNSKHSLLIKITVVIELFKEGIYLYLNNCTNPRYYLNTLRPITRRIDYHQKGAVTTLPYPTWMSALQQKLSRLYNLDEYSPPIRQAYWPTTGRSAK